MGIDRNRRVSSLLFALHGTKRFIMKKEYGFHTNVILNTMCMMVGCDYFKINMQEDNWYFKYEWDEKIEDEFKKWMITYVHKLKPAQQELYDRSYMRKDECEKAVDMFLLSYGWKTKWTLQ